MYQSVLDHGGMSGAVKEAIQVVQYDHMKKGKDFPIVAIPERLHNCIENNA